MAGVRQEQKRLSREKILDAASQRLREGGPDQLGIHAVMQDAGLTHGAFYAHFRNKDELAVAAFEHAIETNQPAWFAAAENSRTFDERLEILARNYLRTEHRNNRKNGCAIAALASEVVNASAQLKGSYSRAVEQTLERISGGDPDRLDEAIEFLASVTGALNMARNARDEETSNRILKVCMDRFSKT